MGEKVNDSLMEENMRYIELIKRLIFKRLIEHHEKMLCKYVSKFMNKNVTSVNKYNVEEN